MPGWSSDGSPSREIYELGLKVRGVELTKRRLSEGSIPKSVMKN
jgi:hypothetical protein